MPATVACPDAATDLSVGWDADGMSGSKIMSVKMSRPVAPWMVTEPMSAGHSFTDSVPAEVTVPRSGTSRDRVVDACRTGRGTGKGFIAQGRQV